MRILAITGILSVSIIFAACTQKPDNHKKTTWEFDELKGYDTDGSWIEKIDYESDIATKITERQIEYYK
jgi:hypothetical protein